MKTPQQIKNEVEKGCGVVFGDCYYEDMNPRECGKDKIHYCKECRDRINILTEYDKSIKEMIEELQKKVRRMLIDNSKCDCTEWTTRYGDISDVCFWEFISKIGDNSEVEK